MAGVVSLINWFDGAASITCSATETLGLAEAQKPWGAGLARIADREFYIDIDLGAIRNIVATGVRGLNGNCFQAVFSFSSLEAGGTDQGTESASYGASDAAVPNDWVDTFGTALWWTGEPKFARYIRIEISGVDSVTDDTWTDIRRIWIGSGVSFTEGVDAMWQMDFVDGSLTDRSQQGAVFVTPGVTWRRVRLGLTNRHELAMFGVHDGSASPLWVLLAKAGRGAEVVVAPRGRGPEWSWYYGQVIHGQLVEWSPLTFQPASLVSMEAATFEEVPLLPLS